MCFCWGQISLHDVILSYFKEDTQQKKAPREPLQPNDPGVSGVLDPPYRHGNWGDRGTCQKVSWKMKFRMSIWRYVTVGGIRIWSVFFNLQMKSWKFYWNWYIYLIVGGLQVHKWSRCLEDQNCEANRWCRMACLMGSRIFLGNECSGYQYTVYPAQNAWIYLWQNFVTGDIPRFKVLRYSEASLFEL